MRLTNALHLVIRRTVDVHGVTKLVYGETVVRVDIEDLLIGVTDGKVGNVLFAVDVGSGKLSDATANASLKWNVPLLLEAELARNWTFYRNRILGYCVTGKEITDTQKHELVHRARLARNSPMRMSYFHSWSELNIAQAQTVANLSVIIGCPFR